jgi:hypothetical protein
MTQIRDGLQHGTITWLHVSNHKIHRKSLNSEIQDRRILY